jgi:ABC-2 type transport system permease protein
MSPRRTWAVALRVLQQIRRDPRTVALLVVVPCVLMTLLWWMFKDVPTFGGQSTFDRLGPDLLAIFPFIVMFLVTSVTTLRERSSGTLERLLAMPLGRLDFLLGYGTAFGLLAALQSAAAVGVSVGLLGLDIHGHLVLLGVVAIADAVLGCALGLFVSAFARTEFQAVQFMPAVVLPQILLCGLFVARSSLPDVLHAISNVLPLSYAVSAMQKLTSGSSAVGGDLAIIAAYALACLGLGAVTLRRRTP